VSEYSTHAFVDGERIEVVVSYEQDAAEMYAEQER
jgi:hypothetical protein